LSIYDIIDPFYFKDLKLACHEKHQRKFCVAQAAASLIFIFTHVLKVLSSEIETAEIRFNR
jgi:hypothetical protein